VLVEQVLFALDFLLSCDGSLVSLPNAPAIFLGQVSTAAGDRQNQNTGIIQPHDEVVKLAVGPAALTEM
jgi:hypothetical protein